MKAILLYIGILIATVSSAVVTTQDTLVVARNENEGTDVTEATQVDLTTEEANIPIKLTEMRVHSEIALRYARTAVVTTVRNPAKRAQEAFFRMLLPETAFISGFVMTLNGKSYTAYVKEKEEAKQIYNQAISQGVGAAHIAAKARDSNHFTVSVNVEPNTTAVFNLTYEELLVRRNGVYNHDINLHPGALVPKMKITVHIRETEKITKLRVPEVRTGNEIDATEEDAQNPIALIDRGHDDREATITFKPNLDEQKRLMELYSIKSKESAAHKPFYQRNEDDEKKQEGAIGQFVVQYDVDRSKNGEVLVNDGYFVHFLAPSSLPPLNKHVVFVLDTSGSMMGRKVEQLREAMQTILDRLFPGDYFSIIEFNSNVVVHDLKEADQPPSERHSYYSYRYEPPVLVPPSAASQENIKKAKTIISRLQAYGGTNINSALSVAIDIIRKGVKWEKQSNETVNATVSSTSTTEVSKPEESVKSTSADKQNDLEPIIIFLTDGDPTEGETDTARILSHLSEKNYGENKAAIFSLAFGEDADRGFLRKLSLKNEGFMRHIYEAADAALQLRDFYQQVSSPLLSNVKFTYPKEQIKEGSLTRNKFRMVYDGSEVVVAGRVSDDVQDIEPHISGFCGVSDAAGKRKYDIMRKFPVARVKHEYMPLERLWAYLTIKQLLDEKDAADSDNKTEISPEKKALEIALKYEFVTPLTSLVVVKPNATNAVNAESVDKQSSDFPDYGSPNIIPLSGQYMSSIALSRPAAPSYLSAGFGAGGSYHLAADAFDVEEDLTGFDDDLMDRTLLSQRRDSITSHIRSGGLSYSTALKNYHSTPLYFHKVNTPVFASTTRSTPPLPTHLSQYHLDDFLWTENLLNDTTNSLDFIVNGTKVSLKLEQNAAAPMGDAGDVQCNKSTNTNAGLCVYVTRCNSAKTITSTQYAELYCVVGDGYAGVCCPSEEVVKN